jgi:hypothetical protein
MYLIRDPFAYRMKILAFPHGSANTNNNGFGLFKTESTVIRARDTQNGIAGLVVAKHNSDNRSIYRILLSISHTA